MSVLLILAIVIVVLFGGHVARRSGAASSRHSLRTRVPTPSGGMSASAAS
jgi:hypothetical protein